MSKIIVPEGTPMTLWTTATVRDELPEVFVRVNGKVVKGQLGGRKNRFASVRIDLDGVTLTAEYAWETVVHALNTGSALTY